MDDDTPAVWSPLSFEREHLLNNAVTLLSLLFWLQVLVYAYNQQLPRPKYATVFLGGGILIYVVAEQRDLAPKTLPRRLLLWGMALVSVVTTGYLYVNYEVLSTTRVGYALNHEYILAALFTVAVVYLTYRAFGAAFVGVVIAALLYTHFGNLIPGLLGHGGVGAQQIVNRLVLEFDGFFGSITQIVAAWVGLFLLYAGLMRGYGAFALIMRGSYRVAEYLSSGVAQSAVLSSLIVGSINGAQTANAAMTGSFTIPLMKESGMKSESAAGVEAVASAGGQIMPPVMGAAAFVMASLLTDISYIDVLVAGIIPAFVFYISVAVGVHYMAVKQLPEDGLDIQSRVDEIEAGYHPAVEAIRFGVPFAILLYTLGIAQWTVITSALYTCIAMFATGAGIPVLLSVVRGGDVTGTVKQSLLDTVEGFKFGAVTVAPITIIIAAVNGIVDLLNATGVTGKLSLALVGAAGGVAILTVILAMIICLILGLGMPTVAAYTIVALLIAPTLTSAQFPLQVPDIAAHFFVFYAAILSGITPPIAIAVVVTTGIADSNFWRTCVEALKLALPLFVLPFTFIYNPEIVAGGITAGAVQSGVIVLAGAIGITHGLNCAPNPFGLRAPLSYAVRGVYVLLGTLAMVFPSMLPRIGAVAVGITLFVVQRWLVGRSDTPTAV